MVAGLIAASPGANKVVESFFSTSGFEDSFEPVVKGFWLNVKLMLMAEAFVLVFGLAIAVDPQPARARAGAAAARRAHLHRRVPRRAR